MVVGSISLLFWHASRFRLPLRMQLFPFGIDCSFFFFKQIYGEL